MNQTEIPQTKNPNTPVETLRSLAATTNYDTRRQVATHPNLDSELMRQLAQDPIGKVRAGVAENTYLTTTMLTELLNILNPNDATLVTLARNQNLTTEMLTKLADSSQRMVCETVAHHENTSPDTLQKLAQHEVVDVKEAVAGNPHTPPDTLHALAQNKDTNVRWYVAENLNTSPETLTQLVEDSNQNVIHAVLENPNTPAALIEQHLPTHLPQLDEETITFLQARPDLPKYLHQLLVIHEHQQLYYDPTATIL